MYGKGSERKSKEKWKRSKRKMKMKGNERKVKGNENDGKWKGNEIKEKWKGKLSDPSPFINILNNIQFLLAVVGIKHSCWGGGVGVLVSLCVWKRK